MTSRGDGPISPLPGGRGRYPRGLPETRNRLPRPGTISSVDWAGWAVFGLAATTLLTSIMVAGHLSGLSRMDLPLMLGTILVGDPDRARVAGFFVHLAVGQGFALIYAAAFALLGTANLWLGAAFGLLHGFAALTLLVPLLPAVHPRMASDRTGPDFEVGLEPPGPFGMNYGRRTPVVALVAHVAYGALLGLLLNPG